MKTKVKLLPMLLMAFIMLTANCCEKDDDPELPPITQTGEDTFGCLVDGEVWLPKGQLIYTPRTRVYLERYFDIKIWHIGASRKISSGFAFRIPEDNLHEGIVNIIVAKSKDLGIYFDLDKKYPNENFSWNKDLQGELIISRLDTINRIVAGTFWFDLMSEKGTKIDIRDGRFDLRINQIEP